MICYTFVPILLKYPYIIHPRPETSFRDFFSLYTLEYNLSELLSSEIFSSEVPCSEVFSSEVLCNNVLSSEVLSKSLVPLLGLHLLPVSFTLHVHGVWLWSVKVLTTDITSVTCHWFYLFRSISGVRRFIGFIFNCKDINIKTNVNI